MAQIREIASGLRAPEGPVAVNDGSVLVVELKGGALTRVADADRGAGGFGRSERIRANSAKATLS